MSCCMGEDVLMTCCVGERVLAGVMEIADGLMQVLSQQQLLTQQHRVSSLDLQVLDYVLKKLIGVQNNHGVEYFGGPAAPTH